MRTILTSIEGEYRRYKVMAEASIHQLSDAALGEPSDGPVNSISTIAWHVSSTLKSRFTDFLTTDGEKPWRDREAEFLPRNVSQDELLEKWEDGWDVLFGTLESLTDEDLGRTVIIREFPLTVAEALHRSLAHVAYHVGQIVFVAKAIRGAEWHYLSIPPGESDSFNVHPDERGGPGGR